MSDGFLTLSVTETIRYMMERFPMLYSSRAQTLKNIFDSSYFEWRNGSLAFHPSAFESLKDTPLPYGEKEILESRAKHPKDLTGELLFRLRENAAAQFILDNVDLLANEFYSKLETPTCISFRGANFDNMPADVTPDWLAAAKELCEAIRHHKFVAADHAPEYVERARVDLENSQEVCGRFLEAHKMIFVDPNVRALRLAKLTQEAAALGLVVRPRD